MEKFAYNSYPDSTDSSPRSREIDFDNPPPWDDQNQNNQNNQNQQQQSSYKVKFMCSYGGKIQPRPHDNQLTYVNGETKILSVDRSIRFSVLASKLAAVVTGGGGDGGEVTFKYQLPGEDLDALISVTNDDDLEHMMHEYDRLVRMSSKPARMRLFLFPTTSGFGSQSSTQSDRDRDRFVEVLNTTVAPRLNESEKSSVPPLNNADFLFGTEKIVAPPPLPSQPPPVAVPVSIEPPLFSDPRLVQPDPLEFQRLQIRDNQEQQQQHLHQEGVYRRKSSDDGGHFSPPYVHNPVMQPPPPQPTVPQTNPQVPPVTYWQGNHNTPGGGVFASQGLGLPEHQQQQVYMIPSPSPASVYHPPPPQQQPQGLMRPQGNQGGGYYPPVQRMAPDMYREQPAYNVTQSQPQVQPPIGAKVVQPPPPAAFTSGPPPPQYSAVPPPRQVVGLPETSAYTPQVAYPGGMGKQQVYYTEAPPPPLQPQHQQYHGIGLPVSGGMTELRTGPDGKIVAMNVAPKISSQNSDNSAV